MQLEAEIGTVSFFIALTVAWRYEFIYLMEDSYPSSLGFDSILLPLAKK